MSKKSGIEWLTEWCAGSTLNETLNYRSRDNWTVHTIHPSVDGAYMIISYRDVSSYDHQELSETIRYIESLRQDLDEAISLLAADERKPLSEEERAKWLGRRSHLRDLP